MKAKNWAYAAELLVVLGLLFLVNLPARADSDETNKTSQLSSTVIGVVDKDRLDKVNPSYWSAIQKVIPVVLAAHKLTLIVTKSGLIWMQTESAKTIDVTDDLLIALSKDSSISAPQPSSASTSPSPSASAPNSATSSTNAPISMTISNKDYHAATYDGDDVQNQITFTAHFTNNTNKDIRAFDGSIEFDDLFDHLIQTVTITHSQLIPVSQTVDWDAGLEYNQFLDEDVTLKNTDLADLKVKLTVTSIIYTDGTQASY